MVTGSGLVRAELRRPATISPKQKYFDNITAVSQYSDWGASLYSTLRLFIKLKIGARGAAQFK
jgi:hypothetical protein